MNEHCTSNFLVQCWARQIQTRLYVIFLWKFVCKLCAKIAKEIFLCNVGQARSREHFIGYFPVKR